MLEENNAARVFANNLAKGFSALAWSLGTDLSPFGGAFCPPQR